jgi:transposase
VGIVDSQSVKNTDCASIKHKGFDGGKKIGGIKRNIIVDTIGLPLAISITPANTGERDGCFALLLGSNSSNNEQELLSCLQEIYADSGYTGERFGFEVYQETAIQMTVIPRNKEKPKEFGVVPKRWVVERSFSWIEKCHRLWKNTERLITSSKAMVQLCFIRLLAKRLGSMG